VGTVVGVPTLERLLNPAKAAPHLPAPTQLAWWALAEAADHTQLLAALARRPDRCPGVAAAAAAHHRRVVRAAVPRIHPARYNESPWLPTAGGNHEYSPNQSASCRALVSELAEIGPNPGGLSYYVEYVTGGGSPSLAGALAARDDLSPGEMAQILPHLTHTHASAAWRKAARRAPFWSGCAMGSAALLLLTKLYGVDPAQIGAVFVDPAEAAATLLPDAASSASEWDTYWSSCEQGRVDAVVASGLLSDAVVAALPVGAVLPLLARHPGGWYAGTLAAALAALPGLATADANGWAHLLTLAATHPRMPLEAALAAASASSGP